eukprot:11222786-Lingulodinium_polyedra.AAC.1
MGQDEYISSLRPIVSQELTGAPPDRKSHQASGGSICEMARRFGVHDIDPSMDTRVCRCSSAGTVANEPGS